MDTEEYCNSVSVDYTKIVGMAHSYVLSDNLAQVNMFVSIVVPTYQDWSSLRCCIEGLLDQTYPRDSYEIIVVNNCVDDTIPSWVEESPITMLSEPKKSSYAARNHGINQSSGEIIGLIDSDCRPTTDWLNRGISHLFNTNSDLVAGRVVMDDGCTVNPFRLYDAATGIDSEYSVRLGIAKTANLFVRRYLFEKVGLFDGDVESGGDVEWTSRTTWSGYLLNYCPDAVVYHPTRGMRQSIRKAWRVVLSTRRTRPSRSDALVHQFQRLAVLLATMGSVRPLKLRERMVRNGTYRWWRLGLAIFALIVVRVTKAAGLMYESVRASLGCCSK